METNAACVFKHRLTLLAYVEGRIQATPVTLYADLFLPDNDDEAMLDLSPVTAWLTANRETVFSAIALPIRNPVLLTPYDADLIHIAALLQAKIEALTGLDVGDVRLEPIWDGLFLSYTGNWREDLPAEGWWTESEVPVAVVRPVRRPKRGFTPRVINGDKT